MENRMTKYSAAAVVALAAALVLVSPFGTSKHGGVALAAAQEKVANLGTMVFRGQKTFSLADDPNECMTFDVVKYFSQEYGIVEEGYRNGVPMYRMVMNRVQKQGLAVFHMWKKYAKYAATDEQIELMEQLAPAGVINLLLQNEHRKLGPRVIDGVDAEGFEVDSLESIKGILPKWLFDIQQGKATAWISKGELLPIRIEEDMRIGKSLATLSRDIRLQETTALESYNVELDPHLFDTSVPEGYDTLGITDFIPGKLSLAGIGILPAGVIVWTRFRRRKIARTLGVSEEAVNGKLRRA
ncbi:MAG: hypothetical protein KBE65_02055 [Phycisphaerae bacterium]|nr:hypothetical protein [Phycisphaerae bacterium]